jgi:hypothetical protein
MRSPDQLTTEAQLWRFRQARQRAWKPHPRLPGVDRPHLIESGHRSPNAAPSSGEALLPTGTKLARKTVISRSKPLRLAPWSYERI